MLIEMLIAASCASGQYNEACRKAMEAGTKQYGVYQDVTKAEDVSKAVATKEVTSVVGTAPVALAGAAAKTIHDRAITYSVKPSNVLSIEQITTKVGANGNNRSGSVVFQWGF